MPQSKRRGGCDDERRANSGESIRLFPFLQLASIVVVVVFGRRRRRRRRKRRPSFDLLLLSFVSFVPRPRRLPGPQLLPPGHRRLHHARQGAPRRAGLCNRRRRVPEASCEAGEERAARGAARVERGADESGDGDGGSGSFLLFSPSPAAAPRRPKRRPRRRRPPLPRRAPDRALRRRHAGCGAQAEARGGEGGGVERGARRGGSGEDPPLSDQGPFCSSSPSSAFDGESGLRPSPERAADGRGLRSRRRRRRRLPPLLGRRALDWRARGGAAALPRDVCGPCHGLVRARGRGGRGAEGGARAEAGGVAGRQEGRGRGRGGDLDLGREGRRGEGAKGRRWWWC